MFKQFIPIAFLLLGGCVKTKLDNTISLQNVGNSSSSSIRLFNYLGAADVTVNNIPLTAHSTGSGNTGSTPVGAAIFPSGVWSSMDDASPFTLPNSLLDKAGNAHFIIITRNSGNTPVVIDTTIANNVLQPVDYYLLPDSHLKPIPRNNLPPSNPQNFKIRIINLGSPADHAGQGMAGPVTLSYADGAPVDPLLTGITQDAISPYIELPYGTYQFKLFYGGGTIDPTRQLSEVPVSANFDPCAATLMPQEGLSPRVRTFKPGGVYSLVVTPNYADVFTDCNHFSHGMTMNGYRTITEQDPGVNNIYARMQAVNALPDQTVTITVDGQPLAGKSGLPYIGSLTSRPAFQFSYDIFVAGSHHVQVQDQGGNTLASGDILLYPYDNYTIWAWPGTDGKPAVLFEPHDMTGTIYTSSYHPGGNGAGTPPDDGTSGNYRRTTWHYALECRFLNLAPDLPYATFTNDNQLFLPFFSPLYADTIRYLSAYTNLAQGTLPPRNASLIYSLPPTSPGLANPPADGSPENNDLPRWIRVSQSSPAPVPEIPGTLLPNVAPVDMQQAFIANPALYTDPRFLAPETGVYTIALVGRTSGAQGTASAKMVVIKHNQ